MSVKNSRENKKIRRIAKAKRDNENLTQVKLSKWHLYKTKDGRWEAIQTFIKKVLFRRETK